MKQEPGFADAAAYFRRRAKKATDVEDRALLSDSAEFYNSLANITYGLPRTGYTIPGPGLYSAPAERWRARAEECRTISDQYLDPQCRVQMLQLAESYELLAQTSDRGRQDRLNLPAGHATPMHH